MPPIFHSAGGVHWAVAAGGNRPLRPFGNSTLYGTFALGALTKCL